VDEHDGFNAEINYLSTEGEFRAVRPGALVAETARWDKAEELRRDFESAASTPGFLRLLPERRYFSAKVYQSKFTHGLFEDFLQPNGLAVRDENNPRIVRFVPRAARLYMSLLAKHLAAIDPNCTVTGTDLPACQDWAFAAPEENESTFCLALHFDNILPVPQDNTPLEYILDLKRRRRPELLRFRSLLDQFQKDLADAGTQRERNEVIVRFGEHLEIGLKGMERLFKDHRIRTAWGSLKALVDVKAPATWLATLGAAASKLSLLSKPLVGVATALAATVQVGSYWVDRRLERNKQLAESPFAYLFHVKRRFSMNPARAAE
jgi:hypothetical protein